MKPVLHHLPEDQLARVKELASRLGITAAELIRRALDRELASHSPPDQENPRMATVKSARKSTMSPAQLYLFEAAKTPGKVSEVKRIGLDHITDDHQYQSRVAIDRNYIHSELLPLLEQYGDLEPIVLFKEYGSERLFIGNGFHRYELYKMARRPDIPCIVIDAGPDWERELRLYSASANLKFSKAPTKEDKIKALHMLFADNEFWTWNDKDLGSRSGLTSNMVSIHRRKYASETSVPLPEMVTVFRRDGRTSAVPYGPKEDLPVPKVKQSSRDPREFRARFNGKRHTIRASNAEEAKEKMRSRLSSDHEERIPRTSLGAKSLREFLVRRGILSEQTTSLRVTVTISKSFLVVSCPDLSSGPIGASIAAMLYFWKKSGFPAVEFVVACYLSDVQNNEIKEILEILSAPGLFQIHFLTPEEIVQRYAPQEEQGEPEPDKA